MSEDNLKITLLAAVNFSAEAGKRLATGWDNTIANTTPTLHFFLTVAQFTVAVATVWYVVRKTQAIKPLKRKNRRCRK